MSSKTTYIFVYGTLMDGQPLNNHLLSRIVPAFGCLFEEGVVDGFDMFTNGSFPMAKEGKGQVYGEVWNLSGSLGFKVSKSTMQMLDLLESGYVRKLVEVKREDGDIVK